MKYCKDFKVIENKILTPTFYRLKLQYPETLPEIKAGQFVEVQMKESANVLLRRPISIHDVDTIKNQISLLVQIVGKGTKDLSTIKEGENLNLVFPLGNEFPIIEGNVLLVGGGCGVAPLLYLARVLNQKGIKPHKLE